MAHTEKDDNHLMEGTEDSAGMKHVHSVPMRMPWKRHLGGQPCDLLQALAFHTDIAGHVRVARPQVERSKNFLKKGRRMSSVGRKTADDSTAGERKKQNKKAESQRAIEKEEITSTEFPEGGNTISTKEPPASQRGQMKR